MLGNAAAGARVAATRALRRRCLLVVEGCCTGFWRWIKTLDQVWKCWAICVVDGGDELGANDF